VIELGALAGAGLLLWWLHAWLAHQGELERIQRRTAADLFVQQYQANVRRMLEERLEPGQLIFFDEGIEPDFGDERIQQALAERAHLLLEGHEAHCRKVTHGPVRKVYSRYGDTLEEDRPCTCRLAAMADALERDAF